VAPAPLWQGRAEALPLHKAQGAPTQLSRVTASVSVDVVRGRAFPRGRGHVLADVLLSIYRGKDSALFGVLAIDGGKSGGGDLGEVAQGDGVLAVEITKDVLADDVGEEGVDRKGFGKVRDIAQERFGHERFFFAVGEDLFADVVRTESGIFAGEHAASSTLGVDVGALGGLSVGGGTPLPCFYVRM
jgi:hypothetical protein